MIGLLINLVIILLILGVIYWITTLFPLPHPFPLIIKVVFGLIAILIVFDLLLGISGSGGSRMMILR